MQRLMLSPRGAGTLKKPGFADTPRTVLCPAVLCGRYTGPRPFPSTNCFASTVILKCSVLSITVLAPCSHSSATPRQATLDTPLATIAVQQASAKPMGCHGDHDHACAACLGEREACASGRDTSCCPRSRWQLPFAPPSHSTLLLSLPLPNMQPTAAAAQNVACSPKICGYPQSVSPAAPGSSCCRDRRWHCTAVPGGWRCSTATGSAGSGCPAAQQPAAAAAPAATAAAAGAPHPLPKDQVCTMP